MAFIFFASRSNLTNVRFTICRLFSFTQLIKRRIFSLRRLVWPSTFYIREMLMLFRKKSKLSFLNSFVSKKIHTSYFFSASEVINKIFRFRRYIWYTFYFFINKNAKKNLDLQLFINDKQWSNNNVI